jgi:hypothetical protein
VAQAEYNLGGTAVPGDVRTGKTFSSIAGFRLSGTLADNGSGSTITPGTANQNIAAGIWDTANTVAGDANLVAGNIKSGVSIFGVLGTYSASANVAKGSVVSSAAAGTFVQYGGTSKTNWSTVTIPVPSGINQLLAVFVQPNAAPPVAVVSGAPSTVLYAFCAATPLGYADGGTSTVLVYLLDSGEAGGNNVNAYSLIAGGSLSLTTSSIVVPCPMFGVTNHTCYYTVIYL